MRGPKQSAERWWVRLRPLVGPCGSGPMAGGAQREAGITTALMPAGDGWDVSGPDAGWLSG